MPRLPDLPGFVFKRLLRLYPVLYPIYARHVPRSIQPKVRRLYERLQQRTACANKVGGLTFDGVRYHAPQVSASHPKGVNVVGLLRTQNGLGEHARLVTQGLQAVQIPIALKDCQFSGAISEGTEVFGIESLLQEAPPYAVNLFCFNPPHIFNLFTDMPPAYAGSRYNIGYGYWELPRYPREWLQTMNLLDEVWAPTRFIQDALSAAASRPVIHMPIPLTIDVPPPVSRAQFSLPENRFLFLFSFDVFSNSARKNPQAVIAAFQRAFPKGTEDAGLVIKVSTHAHMDASRQAAFAGLQALAKADPRVIVVNRMLTRGELSQLMQCCDAYVSLHRSEGLGLGMAESMLLGRPVIATGWSGNLDFTTPDTACLVDTKLVPVGKDEYQDWEGQLWAEPNLDHAADHMQRLAADPASAHALGTRGQTHLRTHFSAEIIGKRYRERLELIGLL